MHIRTKDENIQIEVNNYIHDYTRLRGMAYLCNTYSTGTLRGEEYSYDTKYIQINLTYGLTHKKTSSPFFDEKDMRLYSMRDSEGKNYVDNFLIYEINMDYFVNLWYTKSEKMIEEFKYLIMLDLEESDLVSLSKKDKVIEKYMSELERVNEDPEFYEYMSAEEDNRKIENSLRREWKREGLEEGREKGREEGRVEGKYQSAISLVRDGFDINQVVKSLEIDKEELLKRLG